MPLTKEQKRFRLQFRRRKETFLRTAHKFHLQLRSQVYLMIIFEGRFYVYSSVDHKAWPTRWPPPLKNIEQMQYPLAVINTPETFGPLPESTQKRYENSVYKHGVPDAPGDSEWETDGLDDEEDPPSTSAAPDVAVTLPPKVIAPHAAGDSTSPPSVPSTQYARHKHDERRFAPLHAVHKGRVDKTGTQDQTHGLGRGHGSGRGRGRGQGQGRK